MIFLKKLIISLIFILTLLPTLVTANIQVLDLAQVMYCEARGEGKVGMLAVANVVLNRVNSPKYPNNITAVINQPHQFTCIHNGKRASLRDPVYQQAVQLAWSVVDGTSPRITTATHYHTTSIKPYWSTSLSKLGTIGNHVFYK